MKPHHPTPEMIRVCELKLGDKVMLSGQEYTVTMLDERKITFRNSKNWKQFFNPKSQQKVELVKSKTHDKEKENGLPVSENGKVCH